MLRLALLSVAVALVAGCSPDTSSPTSPDALSPRMASPAEKVDSLDLPFGCEGMTFRVGAAVTGMRVDAHARIDSYALDGTRGRLVFWPLGRHVGPRIASELVYTGNSDDFPLDLRVSYVHPDDSEPAEFLANVDFEMLTVCFDESQGRFLLGDFDEFDTCVPGERIVLQCDRGVSYRIE